MTRTVFLAALTLCAALTLSLVFAVSTASADDSPQQIEDSATELSRRLMGQLSDARTLGDRGATQCLDVALSEVNSTLRLTVDRGRALEIAERTGRPDVVSHLRAVMRSLASRVRQLRQRSSTCLSGFTAPPGVTTVTVVRDPRGPRMDPTVVYRYRMRNERRPSRN